MPETDFSCPPLTAVTFNKFLINEYFVVQTGLSMEVQRSSLNGINLFAPKLPIQMYIKIFIFNPTRKDRKYIHQLIIETVFRIGNWVSEACGYSKNSPVLQILLSAEPAVLQS